MMVKLMGKTLHNSQSKVTHSPVPHIKIYFESCWQLENAARALLYCLKNVIIQRLDVWIFISEAVVDMACLLSNKFC